MLLSSYIGDALPVRQFIGKAHMWLVWPQVPMTLFFFFGVAPDLFL